MRGFKQIDGQHYDESSIHAPVTNAATIRMVLTLMLMGNITAEVVDVKARSILKRRYRGWRKDTHEDTSKMGTPL